MHDYVDSEMNYQPYNTPISESSYAGGECEDTKYLSYSQTPHQLPGVTLKDNVHLSEASRPISNLSSVQTCGSSGEDYIAGASQNVASSILDHLQAGDSLMLGEEAAADIETLSQHGALDNS